MALHIRSLYTQKKLYKINWASRLHDVRKKKKQKTSVCLHARFYPKKKISFIKMRDLLMIFVSNFFIFFILCSTDELFCVISMDVMRCEMWRIDGWGESLNWAILYRDFLNIFKAILNIYIINGCLHFKLNELVIFLLCFIFLVFASFISWFWLVLMILASLSFFASLKKVASFLHHLKIWTCFASFLNSDL